MIEATPRRPPEPLGCYGFGRNQGTVDDHAEVSLLSNPSENRVAGPTESVVALATAEFEPVDDGLNRRTGLKFQRHRFAVTVFGQVRSEVRE